LPEEKYANIRAIPESKAVITLEYVSEVFSSNFFTL